MDDRGLLRVVTAGSVDDGKSTLIGRLLHDTGFVLDDQLDQLAQSSRRRGERGVNLAWLTDGLRAEREQNITIDVAYRFFRTAARRFIVADTPGHAQFTRNMVTGASTADAAVILVDVTKGLVTQARRHLSIATLLRVPHLIVAINKMDLVGYEQPAFDRIAADVLAFARRLRAPKPILVAVSALEGDNVATPSSHMPWYADRTLLGHLDAIPPRTPPERSPFRLPVQYVIRGDGHFRGYAGTVASGRVRRGDAILVLPSQWPTRVAAIETPEGPAEAASAGDAVVIRTADEVGISRGDMIVHPSDLPSLLTAFEADVCWMDGEPLTLGKTYWLLHATQQVRAMVTAIKHQTDVDTQQRRRATTLRLNDVGRLVLTTGNRALPCDPYRANATTGSLILVDPHTNRTTAAGMIV